MLVWPIAFTWTTILLLIQTGTRIKSKISVHYPQRAFETFENTCSYLQNSPHMGLNGDLMVIPRKPHDNCDLTCFNHLTTIYCDVMVIPWLKFRTFLGLGKLCEAALHTNHILSRKRSEGRSSGLDDPSNTKHQWYRQLQSFQWDLGSQETTDHTSYTYEIMCTGTQNRYVNIL